MARINSLPIVCGYCGNIFESMDARKKFCNRSCSAAFNNRKRGGKRMKDCLGCGKKIPNSRNQLYCTSICRKTHLVKQWQVGEWIPDSAEFPQWLRKIVIENGCSKCGWNEINTFSGKSPVQVEHVNGNPTDHNYTNIIALCPNCHSLTSTYGALNKGGGRKHRYKSLDTTTRLV